MNQPVRFTPAQSHSDCRAPPQSHSDCRTPAQSHSDCRACRSILG